LPLQAIKAKFANIKFNPKNEEQKIQVTNYLLNKVMNKPLIAKICNLIFYYPPVFNKKEKYEEFCCSLYSL
jgi:hypothetical protein